jgi:Flp pilus assembly protein TadG
VLIEFAFIALILFLLLAVTFDFGRAVYSAQVIQQAADAGARELAHLPLPATGTDAATGTLQGILASNPTVKQRVYSEDYLVVTPAMLAGQSLTDFFADKPIINQLLLPVMITQEVGGETWVHYPGQLVDASTPSGKTVVIPLVEYAGGAESLVKLVPVVEEITPDPDPNHAFNPKPEWSPFNLLAQNLQPAQRGLVALRINYPWQAAGLTGFQNQPGPLVPIEASDFDGSYGPYAGPAGLGAQAALGKNVRPFRRVLSGQAIYPREVFP